MKAIKLPGTLDSLTTIAQYVISAANAAGLDKKATYKLRLAVDEIATNIIVHGYEEAGIEGEIFCQATLNDDSLTIVLEDEGAKFDPTQHSLPDDLDQPIETRDIGGLGVYLTIEGVDKFTYEWANERNNNIFVVNRTPVIIT